MTLTIYATRGLPGSGKSTAALEFIAQHGGRIVRINNDDLRTMLTSPREPTYTREEGALVTSARTSIMGAALYRGYDVMCDNVNLWDAQKDEVQRLAARYSASVQWMDFTHVSIDECIRRDSLRPKPVGEDVIRRMAATSGLA